MNSNVYVAIYSNNRLVWKTQCNLFVIILESSVKTSNRAIVRIHYDFSLYTTDNKLVLYF